MVRRTGRPLGTALACARKMVRAVVHEGTAAEARALHNTGGWGNGPLHRRLLRPPCPLPRAAPTRHHLHGPVWQGEAPSSAKGACLWPGPPHGPVCAEGLGGTVSRRADAKIGASTTEPPPSPTTAASLRPPAVVHVPRRPLGPAEGSAFIEGRPRAYGRLKGSDCRTGLRAAPLRRTDVCRSRVQAHRAWQGLPDWPPL